MMLITSLFTLNVFLVLADASVAFHKADQIVALFSGESAGSDGRAKRLRSFLPLLVAFYVTLDCYAYSLRHPGYVAGLGLLLLADIYFQFRLTRGRARCG